MTIAAGMEAVTAGVQTMLGLHSALPASASAAGAADFQSGWQSLLAALGSEIGSGTAQNAQPGATQNGVFTAAQEKSTQLFSDPASDPEKETSQASLTRIRPDAIVKLQHRAAAETIVQDDAASSQSAHATGMENSESAGKSAQHASHAVKKPESQNAASPASALLAATIPVPLPAAPQPQRTPGTAAHSARSFLSEIPSAAEHNAGIHLSPTAQKLAPSGIPGADAGSASGAKQDSFIPETRTSASAARSHIPDANASVSAATAQGLQAPAASSVSADDASTINIDAAADAHNPIAASAQNASAAHALPASDKRIGELSASRHGSADAAAVPLPGHTPSIQPVTLVTASSESAFARDAAAAHTAMNPATLNWSAGKDTTPAMHETFAALDSDAAHGPAWLHAGAHSAEAGFEDPALGWVSVRADMSAGGVHAAVVPGTSEAAQTLSTHMAGLSNYLSEHRAPVHTLTLASPNGDAGFSQQSSQEGGQQSGSHNGAGRQGVPAAAMQSDLPRTSMLVQQSNAAGDAAPAATRSGASISLIA